jgi:hypothetical protein
MAQHTQGLIHTHDHSLAMSPGKELHFRFNVTYVQALGIAANIAGVSALIATTLPHANQHTQNIGKIFV